MIECACSCDCDSEGVSSRHTNATNKEPLTCGECGDTIRPMQTHAVGLWWDCSACDDHNDDCGMDDDCDMDKEPDTVNYMCEACTSVCDQLLCGCWWFGSVWETIAEHNGMTLAECIGNPNEE